MNQAEFSNRFWPDNFLIFGCGNMGGAILRGWIAAGIDPARFTVVDPFAPNLPDGVQYFSDAAQVTEQFGAVLLSIKPQMLSQLSAAIAPLIAPDALLLSILAGAKCAAISAAFPQARVVRLMPNLAAQIGKSPLGLWSYDLSDTQQQALSRMLSPLGTPFWLDGEAQMDAFTALAGSGPAFIYRFLDTLAAAGTQLGLDAEQTTQMTLAMAEGAVQLATQSGENPRDLAARVASAGGSTAAGLAVLDAGEALLHLTQSTLDAATRRNGELANIAEQASNDKR